jgi:hypothetical protein
MYHLKFYADCPENGPLNKFFCYPVHDGKHACDLLARFLSGGYRLRAAFIGLPGALGEKLPASAVNFPSSVSVASSMLLKYRPHSAVNSAQLVQELEHLAAQYPHLRGALNELRQKNSLATGSSSGKAYSQSQRPSEASLMTECTNLRKRPHNG